MRCWDIHWVSSLQTTHFSLSSLLPALYCRYTSWLCIKVISATSYALVGVLNKFLTLLLNILIWDKHSSPIGLLSVCVCLGAGVFYEQAPSRQKMVK
jgi:solute carrier family 35